MKKILFIFGLLLPFVLFGSLTWTMDPQNVFAHPWNRHYRQNETLKRAQLALEIKRVKPKTFLLGSSRIHAISTNYPILKEFPPVLVGSLPASAMTEYRWYVEHAEAVQPLKRLVIELTWVRSFLGKIPVEFSSDRLLRVTQPTSYGTYLLNLAKDYYLFLFSRQIVDASVADLLYQAGYGSQYAYFSSEIPAMVRGIPRAPDMSQEQKDPFGELKVILDMAHSFNFDVFFFIPPFSASFEENTFDGYRVRGAKADGFAAMQLWERQLVQLFADESERTGKTYHLWDFSGFTSVAMAPLSGGKNQWFDDDRHFNGMTGKMMLDRLFGACASPCAIPEDFGVRLTRDNLEEHLETVRQNRAQYLQSQVNVTQAAGKAASSISAQSKPK